MPYTIRKIAKKNCYKVMNRKSKRVFAKCTTKEKAKKQLRLLNAIEYNKNFVPRNRTLKNNNSKSKSK
jgi:hypothetical protein